MNYVGIDIVEIDRLNQAIDRWRERFLRRIYTTSELELYRTKPHSLAARFAGKEAVMKVLGTAFSWQEIEILSLPSGKPRLNLYGKASEEAGKLGVKEIAISLSHCRRYAVASAVGNRENTHR